MVLSRKWGVRYTGGRQVRREARGCGLEVRTKKVEPLVGRVRIRLKGHCGVRWWEAGFGFAQRDG